MAILRAAATASFTLDNTGTPVLITGLTLTPAANDYLLFATVETENASSGGGDSNEFSVWIDGTIVAHTERNHQEESSYDGDRTTVVLNATISPAGSQDVEIRHAAASSSNPQTAFRRELTLFPIPTAGTDYQQIGTSSQDSGSTSWVTLNNMSVTPVANDYLLVFGCEYETSGDDPVAFRVEVAGTPIAHTVRQMVNDGSAANAPRSMLIACEVNPNGSQVVEIAWQNVSGGGTVTVNERAMQLVPVDSADIVEASGTADDSRSTTGEILIDDMTIADPGDNDWLVLFSSWDTVGTIGNLIQTTYMIYEGGAKVTDSDRRNDHEGSMDGKELPVAAGGRVTIGGATDDLQAYWDVDASDTWTLHERTLVAIREASAAQVFTAALRSRLAIRATSGGAKTFVGVGQHSAAMSSAAAAQKTSVASVQASMALRTRLDGIRAFLAAIVARLAVTSRSAAAKQAEATTRDSIALRSLDAGATVRGGSPVARLATRSLNGAAKISTGIAVHSFGLRSFTTAQKTFAGTASMNFALRPGSIGQKVVAGIGAHSFSVRITSEGVAIFAAAFPYHVIKENDRDMRAMITL